MRLIVNIEAGNLVDVEETAPGHFRARMKPETPSVYPYPTHQLCWFIARFEGIAPGGEACELTLVNCEWNPDGFRTMRPFLCYESDWQRSTGWTHDGLVGMQLDSTRSDSSRVARVTRSTPTPAAPAVSPAAPIPAPAPPAPAKAKPAHTPVNKRETATLNLFPPTEEEPPAAPVTPASPAVATAVATPANASTTPPPAPPATGAPVAGVPAGPLPTTLNRDFTGGSMTYRFFLKGDCTVALHPPYTAEMLKADLERWGLSPHLHYQRLGASHGGKSFFVVDAARHRAKGINPALPFLVLLAREHGVEPAVNWVVRGLMDRLLAGDGHPALDRLRLVLFPFINQDGAYQGMTVDPHTGMDVGNDFGRAGSPAATGSLLGAANPLGSGSLSSSNAPLGAGQSASGAANPPASDAAGSPNGNGGGASGRSDNSPEFKLPESRMIYRYVADQIRAGRHCLGALSLHQPHGGQENIWPVYYLGPGRNCLDPALTAFQRALQQHTRRFTHTTPDFWPLRVSVGRFDHDFGIPGVTLEINPHCSRNPLSVAGLEALGAALADVLAAC